ncbi:CHASE2 domain-containing protein [uncultured Desulfobacter sp.]|uniref:CHASE2 domain-containing protein n=1 Tax=uncultured Desulfobacter sp. TaxID=240139 RepID=UPI0029C85392|nr:CHASE2 domain-containing protein [uncultured Desulfobacter sp.]
MTQWFRFTALNVGLLIICGIELLSIVNFFVLPNGVIYDTFCKLPPKSTQGSKKVMIVPINQEQLYSDDETWILFLNNLHDVNAKQILFSFFPPRASEQFYARASEFKNVIFGRQKQLPITSLNVQIAHQPRSGAPGFVPIPDFVHKYTLKIAPYDLPVNQYGIHRFAHAFFLHNEAKKHIEPNFILAAAQMRDEAPQTIDSQFAINFIATAGALPNISFESILSGNIVSELFQDRTLLVGFGKSSDSPGFQTPVHTGSRTLSLVEYNGFALDTLIENRIIQWPGRYAILLIVSGIVIGCLFVFPLFSDTLFFICAGLFYLFTVIGSFLLLRYALVWLPIMEIMAAETAVFMFVFGRKYVSKNKFAREVMLNKSTQLKDRFFPDGFYASQAYWAKVVNMVNQTLNLERVIFLEKVPDDHRVREIIALNTSIENIQERRRDYERTPYSTAIGENRPIEVTSFFKGVGEEDVQYLVPLSYAGQVQGFWAFVISSRNMLEVNYMLSIIRNFAVEIGELLYKREQWLAEKKKKQNLFRKLLAVETRDDLYHEVNAVISMLVRRLSTLDHLLNALESPIILYDIFGQVTHVNHAMNKLLNQMKVAPFKMSALDLAIRLTGHNAEEMRDKLSQVMLSHIRLNLPVTLSDAPHAYRLSIHPLVGEDETLLQDDQAYPFNIHGMLFEMTDLTETKDLSLLKSDVFERSNVQLKHGVESITNACVLLEDEGTENKDQILTELLTQKDKMISFMDELSGYMDKEIMFDGQQLFPVMPLKQITDALALIKEDLEKKKITIDLAEEHFLDMALAVPSDLKTLCKAMLFILLEDAFNDTTIHITAANENGTMCYTLFNTGYGMPNEDFQRHLTSKQISDTTPYQQIYQFYPKLEHWKAHLSGSSEVGKGIIFMLKLQKFH